MKKIFESLLEKVRTFIIYTLFPNQVIALTEKELFRFSVQSWVFGLGLYLGIQILFSLYRLDYLFDYQEILSEMLDEGRIYWWYYWMNAYPYDIVFSLFLSLFLLLWWTVWSSFTLFLFRKRKILSRIVSLNAFSQVYFLISFTLIFISYRIAPDWIQSDTFGISAFIGMNLLFLFFGCFFQAFSFFKLGASVLEMQIWKLCFALFVPYFLLYLIYLWGS